jgi:hypothetical protein
VPFPALISNLIRRWFLVKLAALLIPIPFHGGGALRYSVIHLFHVASSFCFFCLARFSYRLFPNFRWDALWGIYSDVTFLPYLAEQNCILLLFIVLAGLLKSRMRSMDCNVVQFYTKNAVWLHRFPCKSSFAICVSDIWRYGGKLIFHVLAQ